MTAAAPVPDVAVPVVALTGHLGAGKTTLLNHLLRRADARVGVIINDFGAINVDAGLVTGHVDEAASISGGCVCCLDDSGGLDVALARLTQPRLRLDVVVVETSGLAEPVNVARLIQASAVPQARFGGVVDVVDTFEYFHTVDRGGEPPARFSAASLIVLNKTDLLPGGERAATLGRIEARIRERNPAAYVVVADRGRIDPALVYDVAAGRADDPQLAFDLLAAGGGPDEHVHAASVSASSSGAVDAGRLVALLQDPPPGAYRIKGTLAVATPRGPRGYAVHVVGRSVHVSSRRIAGDPFSELVAIGYDLDVDRAGQRLREALAPAEGPDRAGLDRAGLSLLERLRRLS